MKLRTLIALPILLGLTAWASARAEDATDPTPATPVASEPAATPAVAVDPLGVGDGDGDGDSAPPMRPTKARKGRRGGREKEAEGTQAPNRFEADTVIKSQYKLDGQLLEVDPD